MLEMHDHIYKISNASNWFEPASSCWSHCWKTRRVYSCRLNIAKKMCMRTLHEKWSNRSMFENWYDQIKKCFSYRTWNCLNSLYYDRIWLSHRFFAMLSTDEFQLLIWRRHSSLWATFWIRFHRIWIQWQRCKHMILTRMMKSFRFS